MRGAICPALILQAIVLFWLFAESIAPQRLRRGVQVTAAQVAALDQPSNTQPRPKQRQLRRIQPASPPHGLESADHPLACDEDSEARPSSDLAVEESTAIPLRPVQTLKTKDAKNLLAKCLHAVSHSVPGQRSALTEQMGDMFAVNFEDARDGICGRVEHAVNFWDRMEVTLEVVYHPCQLLHAYLLGHMTWHCCRSAMTSSIAIAPMLIWLYEYCLHCFMTDGYLTAYKTWSYNMTDPAGHSARE